MFLRKPAVSPVPEGTNGMTWDVWSREASSQAASAAARCSGGNKKTCLVTTLDIEPEHVFHRACFWLYMRMLLLKWFIFLHAPLLLRFNLGMAHFWRKKNNPNLSARLINYKPSHCEVQAMSTNARSNPWISCHFFPNAGRVYSQQKPRWQRWRLDVQSNFHHV